MRSLKGSPGVSRGEDVNMPTLTVSDRLVKWATRELRRIGHIMDEADVREWLAGKPTDFIERATRNMKRGKICRP